MAQTAVSFLERHPAFAVLSASWIRRLAGASEVRKVARRRPLWRTGDLATHAFIVRRGLIKISSEAGPDRQYTLWFHGKGALLGEAGALLALRDEQIVRQTDAVAWEEAEVFALSRASLEAAILSSPVFGLRMAQDSAERRLRVERRLGVLLHRSAHARLASLFLALADDFGVRDSRGVIVNLRLTHREMASLIGVTRETVSFALLELRQKGMVETEGKRVVLLDEGRLRALAVA